jgi:hypothetical protein
LFTTVVSLPPKETVVSITRLTSSNLPTSPAQAIYSVAGKLRSIFSQHSLTPSCDANLCAFRNECLSDGSTNPCAASGNQCNFSFQSHVLLLRPLRPLVSAENEHNAKYQ